jgi:Rrf2 family transcriptional regulator, cysteine metabolism repressor
MKLSTRGRYGTRAMLDLALLYGQGPVFIKDVASRQDIPVSYLENLMSDLRVAGLVSTARGMHGGYYLAKPPSEINLNQVIAALEGSMALVECVDDPKHCSRAESCVTRDIWSEVRRAIEGVLESITLEDLTRRYKEKQLTCSSLYYI